MYILQEIKNPIILADYIKNISFKLNIDESVIRKFAEKEIFTSVEEIECVEFVKSLGYDDQQTLDKLDDCV